MFEFDDKTELKNFILFDLDSNPNFIKKTNKKNQSLLHLAIFHKFPKNVIQKIIQYESNINRIDLDSETPLHYACKYKSSREIIKILVKNGSKINLPNSKNQYPLHIASKVSPRTDILSLLVNRDLDINAKDAFGMTSMHYCIQNKGDFEAIKFLQSTGGDINIQNKEGRTPLHMLCSSNTNLDLIKGVINLGADVTQVDNNGKNVLHILCSAKTSEAKIAMLIQKGAQINVVDNMGKLPLHEACRKILSVDILRLLVDENTDLNQIDNQKKSPLSYFLKGKSKMKQIKFLIWKGADIPVSINGKHSKSMIQWWKCYNSICEDFANLVKRQEFCDFQLEHSQGFIGAHESILRLRLNDPEDKVDRIPLVIKALKTYSKASAMRILNFIYSGHIYPQNWNKFFPELLEFVKEIGKDEKWIALKRGRCGLVRDLTRLFHEKDSKDFTIFCNDIPLRIHKLVLITRSETYRQMFLQVNDNSNQVNDYSGKSEKSLRAFFEFLYTDDISMNLEEKQLVELNEAQDYYQMNQNSSLKDVLIRRKQNWNY
ncbi:phytochrome-interacting ankyrin-repeat protein [Anaeramoeba ignava]|uniref:Phytochrome-interacting ankyrin-repeat protein n=1 Tax=Anaeramoeba ignava TaxID=1746090 RepID=A0A9Q0LPR2_ANAIG|nr:phytochrome-interacting ankyrin-repeat protein [Anaeramoeba ignava]